MITRAEALMARVARDPTRLALALEHQHVGDAASTQLERARESRRPAANDDDRGVRERH